MQNFKTEKVEEWYILMPQKVAGSITKTSKGLYFSDSTIIETFTNKEACKSRCIELGIEEDFINNTV